MNWQKRRWIAREILGHDIGPKPPESERRGPERDFRYRAYIRKFPCACCGAMEFIECAHVGSDGGMAQKCSDYETVPLCAPCHRTDPKSYHQIGKAAFEERHGLNFKVMTKRLYKAYLMSMRRSA